MENIKTYEGFLDNIRKAFDPNPLKQTDDQSWSIIEQELEQMIRSIDMHDVYLSLSSKGDLMMKNYIKERKSFLKEYGGRSYIIKDGDRYKIDIKKFLKDPEPWIFTKEQRKKCLEYFTKDFEEKLRRHKETEEHRSTLNGYVYKELPKTPYLVNPVVNVGNILKKINESTPSIDDNQPTGLVTDLLSSVNEFNNCLTDLLDLWYWDNWDIGDGNDRIDLNDYLWGAEWTDSSFDEMSIDYWISNVCTEFEINIMSIPISIDTLPKGYSSNFRYKQHDDDTKEIHMQKVCYLLKKMVAVSKCITDKASKFDNSILPTKEYPFIVELEKLHYNIEEWVDENFGEIADIAMRKVMNKAFKQINK